MKNECEKEEAMVNESFDNWLNLLVDVSIAANKKNVRKDWTEFLCDYALDQYDRDPVVHSFREEHADL